MQLSIFLARNGVSSKNLHYKVWKVNNVIIFSLRQICFTLIIIASLSIKLCCKLFCFDVHKILQSVLVNGSSPFYFFLLQSGSKAKQAMKSLSQQKRTWWQTKWGAYFRKSTRNSYFSLEMVSVCSHLMPLSLDEELGESAEMYHGKARIPRLNMTLSCV